MLMHRLIAKPRDLRKKWLETTATNSSLTMAHVYALIVLSPDEKATSKTGNIRHETWPVLQEEAIEGRVLCSLQLTGVSRGRPAA
jgi:hypothetical protein